MSFWGTVAAVVLANLISVAVTVTVLAIGFTVAGRRRALAATREKERREKEWRESPLSNYDPLR